MRYQKKTNERRAVILMVVLSLLTLFALVGITFVLYADAEATAARVFREAETAQAADVNPQEALAFFLGQLIYDVPDTAAGAASGLRGHSLARTMYGYQYPGLNVVPFNGIGRLHYGSPLTYPPTPLTNVPPNWGTQLDDYALVNYTWFPSDGFVRDPERFGSRSNAQLLANTQPNPYVGGNAPYTYPDLNNFFLAAMKADGTVLTPSYHRPWLFQVVGGKYYAFNDMTNPNWTNQQGKYLTLRPRPAEHPSFPPPGDATGDVKNLPWAPGGNDSIWVDLGAPVMTAPDGTLFKMLFAPLIIDLDNRINLNTAGNILGYLANMAAPTSWQQASNAHVSNQGWGPWEVNLSKVLWADQALWAPSTPPTPPEWMRLLTGMSPVVPTPPNILPIVQPGVLPPTPLPLGLSTWLLPGVRGRYLESLPNVWTPNAPPASVVPFYPSAISLNTTYQHAYAQSDENGLNESNGGATPSSRPLTPGTGTNPAVNPFASFQQGYNNGNTTEATNHPLLYNAFQTPLTTSLGTRAFTAQDQAALLRPNASINGPVDADASAVTSDLLRLCPTNFPSNATLASLPAAIKSAALRFRNLVTTQSWDIGSPGVTPYWWNGMTTGYLTANAMSYLLAPYGAQPAQGAAQGFPPLPPTAGITNLPGTIPITSEFGPDWRAVSANSAQYWPTTNPAGYVSSGARIRLNRPLPPYPHMGAGLVPPYNSLPPAATLSPYGVAYNLTNLAILNQYNAAQNARQALANDIYRRLLAITGTNAVFNNPANPAVQSANETTAQYQSDLANLAMRRWLAQLAVNIVDFIDEDDIMTPFNFYTVADGLAAANLGTTLGPDDPGTNPNNYPYGGAGTNLTGANPAYWVFGTELPKVVLNEVLAEANNPNPQAQVNSDNVKVWVELFNTMPAVGTGGTNTQPQDAYRVPLYVTLPSGGGYSPYRISIAQYTMDRANPPLNAPGTTPELPDVSANVLGKAYISSPFPQSTTDVDFSGIIPLIGGGNQPAYTVPGTGNSINAGVDVPNGTPNASPFFLIGPKTTTAKINGKTVTYPDPFVAANSNSKPPTIGVPPNTPVLRTDNMSYTPNWTNASTTDERSYGLTVMLRRLANPYLPPQLNPGLPNYNPYVTVDYIPSVPIQGVQSTALASFGKRQPYAGLNLLTLPITYGTIAPSPTSPVSPQAGGGAYTTTGTTVTSTFGVLNSPLPQSGHYDWLVHLDRPPISPMELLHVSAWPPYKLTQQFMLGADNTPTVGNIITTFAHYAPWFDALPAGETLATTPNIITCPWWFDPNLPTGSSHRLYRLFEFLECGDRAFGVNGLGRIPGKVNINTIWDPEILQALIDANLSMGIAPSPSNVPLNVATDPVAQVFANMMASRSPSYYNGGTYTNPIPIGPVNMGTGLDDRPFMPLSTGLNLGKSSGCLQFPNGFSVTTDTILRTNNAFAKAPTYPGGAAAANNWLLFQNYTDTQQTHPYYQTQLLTKLYNNVTTRSNVFAVFLTVGFFQVTNPNSTPPQLGPELGASEGKRIRHRMFAIVDRTNLATFATASMTPVTGPNAATNPPNFTGTQTIQLPVLPPPLTITGTGTGATAQLFVPNPNTGVSGVIQAGTQLVIDPGNVNEETITVSAVTPPSGTVPATLTANFTLPHAAGALIIQRGNPGPWILNPYDPRRDPGVVLYFSIIE